MTDAGIGKDDSASDSVAADPSNLYELLEVSPRASREVIQAAYRALVRHYHPDVNDTGDASTQIRRLNAAYYVLGDPERRAHYDLEYLRSHRLERMSSSESASRAATSRSPTPLPSQRTRRDRTIEAAPLLSAQILLGLLMLAAITVIVIAVVWVSFDAGTDYAVAYPGSVFETGR
jgi:hypothetical protein